MYSEVSNLVRRGLFHSLSMNTALNKPVVFGPSLTPVSQHNPSLTPVSPALSLTWFSTGASRAHGHDHDAPPGNILVRFILKDGTVKETMAREGEIALRLAQRYDIPLEGACEASLACTTCHCYVEEERYWDRLPEATEEEEDLLDQAPFLEMNSRLGCQIIINQELEGITLRLPRATKNFYVDGHVPQPH